MVFYITQASANSKFKIQLSKFKINLYLCDMMEHPENDPNYAGLTVNSGVAQPPIVNPYLQKRPRRKPLPEASEMVEGILRGDTTMLSRAVTLVESTAPEHYARAQEVIEKCLPYSGHSRRIGITGVPGAGKSTSIDVFGLHVLRETGARLAVLSIDPSAPARRPEASAAWPARPARQLCSARPPDSIIFSSRPSV